MNELEDELRIFEKPGSLKVGMDWHTEGTMKNNTFKSQVQLGEEYRDTVSKYVGTATAAYFFLHGCERVLLERWDAATGRMLSETFDAPRLEHVETREQMTSPRTGGWQPEPASKDAAVR